MITDERDEVIDRAARSLSALPMVNPMAVLEITSAAAVHRSMRPARARAVLGWFRRPSLSLASTGLLMAAALVIGFVTRAAMTGAAETLGTQTSEHPVLTPAADAGAASRGVPVPMVYDAKNARSVTIVGDFNSWDPSATPMTRVGVDGPWAATVLAKPGRHVYAFLVDGTTLVADPRSPRARDNDYGGDASVLMVPTP